MTHIKSGCRAGYVLGFVVVFCLLPFQTGSAQQTGFDPYGVSTLSGNPLTQLRQRLAQGAFSTSMLPMEGAVDPEIYIVGPGDFFAISIGLLEAAATPVAVGADGRLLLPDAGPVQVAGMTLAQARSTVLEQLGHSFQNTPIDIVLTQSRQFYVHVAGAVPAPGRYLALPVARVSSILEIAFSDSTRAPVANSEFQPALRNIHIVHSDGTEDFVDLLHYFSAGETTHNPFLRDGDVIFVPAFDPVFSSIYIDGAVPFPGPYDYRSGDTLSDLLEVAGGIDEGSAENIRILRSLPDGETEEHIFTKEEADASGVGSFRLLPRDHISIARNPDILGSAKVEGMVHHPGTYPITDKHTTLKELLELAGGLRDDALLRGSYLVRSSLPKAKRSTTGSRFESPFESLQKMLSADTTEIMQRLRLTDLDFLSRSYFAQAMRLQNRVSLDLEKSLEESSDPVILRDGDRLVIPRDENTVYVFGQVTRPGFVAFTPDRTAEDYIEDAGGRGQFSSNMYLVHPATGAFATAGSRVVQSGDLIFVDRALNVADSPELQRLITEQERTRADARIRTMQTVLQSVATVATVVALIISLRRN